MSWKPCLNFESDNKDEADDSSLDLEGDAGSKVVEVVVGAVNTKDDRWAGGPTWGR